MNSFKTKCFQSLFVEARSGVSGLSRVNKILVVLILLSLMTAVLETEVSFYKTFHDSLNAFEIVLAFVFFIEYVLRVWTSNCKPEYQGKYGRLKFMLSIGAIIDLLAFLPSIISIGGSDAFILRVVRLGRLLRFAKLGKYSNALRNIEVALKSCAHELGICVVLALTMILLGASLLYVVEGDVQPEQFGSIPRALWWSVATLTTIGYGDVYPISALGKICAGLMAFIGVATVALPAGILAGAFQNAAFSTKKPSQSLDADDYLESKVSE